MAALLTYGKIAAFSVIWSSAFIVGKIAVRDVDPLEVLSLRFILSGMVLTPLWILSIRNGIDIRVVKRGAILGILNNTMYLGLTFAAIRMISPALVIVIISCSPFITILMVAAMGQTALSLDKVTGMAIGFVGVLIIAAGQGAFPGNSLGVVLALAGTVSFCAGTLLFSGKATSASILQMNFYQSTSAAISLSFCAFVSGSPLVIPSLNAVLVIVYLAIVVSILGMALWLNLIRLIGPTVASSIYLLNPVVGLILSASILGRSVSSTDVVGSIVIAVGLLIVLRTRRHQHVHQFRHR